MGISPCDYGKNKMIKDREADIVERTGTVAA